MFAVAVMYRWLDPRFDRELSELVGRVCDGSGYNFRAQLRDLEWRFATELEAKQIERKILAASMSRPSRTKVYALPDYVVEQIAAGKTSDQVLGQKNPAAASGSSDRATRRRVAGEDRRPARASSRAFTGRVSR